MIWCSELQRRVDNCQFDFEVKSEKGFIFLARLLMVLAVEILTGFSPCGQSRFVFSREFSTHVSGFELVVLAQNLLVNQHHFKIK